MRSVKLLVVLAFAILWRCRVPYGRFAGDDRRVVFPPALQAAIREPRANRRVPHAMRRTLARASLLSPRMESMCPARHMRSRSTMRQSIPLDCGGVSN
jgi:hypothetical protein